MPLVGSSVPMVGGRAKVAGALEYIADLEFPGMLHVKALRSPHPHAMVRSIDASGAEELAGVCAVVTRDDLLGLNPYFGTGVEDQPVVAIDRVRYVGDIVAAVAAESPELAEQAVERIDVVYEELPAAATIDAAIAPDAPLIHDAHVTRAGPGNTHSTYESRSGDIDAGFDEADQIIENQFFVPPVQHGHIEPHGVVAYWEPEGKLVVHTPCQTPSPLQEQLAKIFNLSLNRVRVIVPPVGGGYGGKNHARIEPIVALLSRKARRPARWILTREEVFLTGRRFGALIKMRTGFTNDGRLVARRTEVFYDMGAYALSGPANTKNACYIAGGPYNVPHRHLTTHAVYTNLPPAGPYRGVGASHVCWAYESEMDMIARRLGIDPLALRLENLIKEDDVFVTGESMVSVGIGDCLKEVAAAIGWRGTDEQQVPRQSPRVRGKGVAVAIKSTSTPSTSSASVRLNADGSAVLFTSSVDIGQGARTSLAQIVGDELGLPLDRVTVMAPDTDVTPYDKATSSSRTTFHMGQAAQRASAQIREQLFEAATKELEVRKEDLVLSNGRVEVKGVPGRGMTISRAFEAILGDAHGSLFGACTLRTEGGVDSATGRGKGSSFWFFSACAAEVEVDVETGKVWVVKAISAVDVGKAVHPRQCDLQNEGSLLAGLGSTLFEEMCFADGNPVNASFTDYMLPSMEDQPGEFRSRLVENPHPDGPFGAKGMGEAALPPSAAAIGNAVANALGGIHITDLPLRPEKIVAALSRKTYST